MATFEERIESQRLECARLFCAMFLKRPKLWQVATLVVAVTTLVLGGVAAYYVDSGALRADVRVMQSEHVHHREQYVEIRAEIREAQEKTSQGYEAVARELRALRTDLQP